MQKINLILPVVLMVCSCTRHSDAPADSPMDYNVSTYTTFPGYTVFPVGLAEDASGNLYACDGQNGAIWKITPDTVITEVDKVFGYASGIVCDGQGNLYVLAPQLTTIIKIAPGGAMTTFAGGGSGQADGQGTAAGFNLLNAVDIDGAGTLYIADAASIRKVDQQGFVTTLYHDNSTNTLLHGICVDSHHHIYYSNLNEIWQLDTMGNRTLFAGQEAGSSSVDGTGSSASFESIDGLGIDKDGNLWVSDATKVRVISPSGVVSTVAGTGGTGTTDGPGNVANFNFPTGIAIDPGGVVFVADDYNGRVRKITRK